MTVGSMVPAGHESPAPSRQETAARIALTLVAFAVVAWLNWAIALFAIALLISITLHELGHYLGAKWGGMKPTEFFIGFGPRIFSWRRGETEYGLKPILLGAYVKVPGMHNLDEVDPADETRTYRAQSYGRRARMVFAGPGMNLAVALIGFIAFFALYAEEYGTDTSTPAVLVARQDDDPAGAIEGPAGAAGVRDDDRIVAIDGQTFGGIEAMIAYVRARPGEPVTLTLDRAGRELEVVVPLGERNPATGAEVGYLGLQFLGDVVRVERNPLEAVQRGFEEFGTQVHGTVVGIAKVFSPAGIADLFQMVIGQKEDDPTSRPTSLIGIGRAGGEAVESGFRAALGLTASLNLALGMFNLLPVLPFDGGHLLIATYERLRSRNGKRYTVDFARVMPIFMPIMLVILFVVFGAVVLDFQSG